MKNSPILMLPAITGETTSYHHLIQDTQQFMRKPSLWLWTECPDYFYTVQN